MTTKLHEHFVEEVVIPLAGFHLEGELIIPPRASGVVLFAHGSGSSRHSPRNQLVARVLRERGAGTLLFDLLTPAEEREDHYTGHLRFDIELLARRLQGAANWFHRRNDELPIGYFGSSTGGAAALLAETHTEFPISAIVSRGGRPDLATDGLPKVRAATLLIVGGNDTVVRQLNERAFAALRCEKELRVVPGANHLFEEPGGLEQVAEMAAEWFESHFKRAPSG